MLWGLVFLFGMAAAGDVFVGRDAVYFNKTLEKNNQVNMLHGVRWGVCDSGDTTSVPCRFVLWTRHVEQEIADYADLFEIAVRRNVLRASSPEMKNAVYAGRQLANCVPPACVGSMADLLVCAGVGLSVEEWASLEEIKFVSQNENRGFPKKARVLHVWRQNCGVELEKFLKFADSPTMCTPNAETR